MTDLVVVVGATATGKTALGVDLARRVGGEIVSADAFAVYRGLDIGTAKPSPELRARVPHHLLDVADPRERYSAGMFARDAAAAIAAIRARGRVPIVVGGTLFYVKALLHGLFQEPPKVPRLREHLQALWRSDRDAVHRWLRLLDAEAADRIAPNDQQRILRALEVSVAAGRPLSALWREAAPPRAGYRPLIMGIALHREVLRARISERVASMFTAGLLDEVRSLLAAGVSAEAHALKAIGYRECCEVLRGGISLDEARERTVTATRQLAKRQVTWLRGEAGTIWLRGADDEIVTRAVAAVEAGNGTGTGSAPG